jgi:hypothetical protein
VGPDRQYRSARRFLVHEARDFVDAESKGAAPLVNTSSGAGVKGIAGQAAYCAAKFGIIGLTKAAALDSWAGQIEWSGEERLSVLDENFVPNRPMAGRTRDGHSWRRASRVKQ